MDVAPPPPRIFSKQRRLAVRARMARQRLGGKAVSTVARELAADALDRLGFLNRDFTNALVIGDVTGGFAEGLGASTQTLRADPSAMLGTPLDEESPLPGGPYDLIVSLGLLDTVNDLPGALALMRRALAADGLMLASFLGAGSLPVLRAAMLAADGDRPAPRIHPQVDVRAAGQLMTRIGFASPVVDGWGFEVAFESLEQLVGDLRAQGLGNVLNDPGPSLGKSALVRAQTAFADRAGDDGLVRERFEVVTLSGWSPAPRL
ncbi:methyltransferase domain-containing protein [Croceicoccus sp. BE223]|uniref:methyltransferase domain-containing protein n=1 Tax=Croceicoccus sp. BE223 TaxID=2817716 RepID=UPI00285D38CF|nr:methyltransferase domain-containing protein [Croceicoccus sp. BE223]MDR7103212.1 SAM-dependent methyltransferase [Croceicoccus sp. BE223]